MYVSISSARNWLLPLSVLVALALLLRFCSFFPTVINHDESTYILIARDILHGKHYFVDVIDTKPIGIFFIYAVFDWLAGPSIFLFRVFVAIGVGLTGFCLFQIVEGYLGNRKGAWVAGGGYVVMTSIFTFYGVSPNTELFFVGFTVVALWLLLGGRQWWRFLLAGGALGIGFMIKYVVAFDALAFGLLAIWLAHRREGKWWEGVLGGGLMFICFLVPFALVFQYYRLLGYESEFLYYTFEVPSRYPVERTFSRGFEYFIDFIGRYLPITGLAIFALIKGKKYLGDLQPFFLIWLALTGFIIGWPGKNFGHYFVQWMPPFCLLAGVAASHDLVFFNYLRKIPIWLRLVVVIILAGGLFYTQKKDYIDKWDGPKAVSQVLQGLLEPGDQIYTGNYQQILYYLLEKETPTPYVHRSLLWAPHHLHALEIDLEEEARQIVALRPRFMTMEYTPPPSLLTDSLLKYYHPIDTVNYQVTIYERNE